MPKRVPLFTGLLLAATVLLIAEQGLAGAPKGIKPGDKVRVTIGPAPLVMDGAAIATVRAGTVLVAQEVREAAGVKVTVDRDGKELQGWIAFRHLALEGPPPAKPAATPAEEPPADSPTKPTATPLPLEASNAVHLALRKALVEEAKPSHLEPGMVPVSSDVTFGSQYLELRLEFTSGAAPCLCLGRKLKLSIEYRRGKPHKVEVDTTGLVLAFPDGFSVGDAKFPACTMLRNRGGSWETITTPGAFDKLVESVAQDLRRHSDPFERSGAARALGFLGPLAAAAAPAVTAACKDRDDRVAKAAAEALKKVSR